MKKLVLLMSLLAASSALAYSDTRDKINPTGVNAFGGLRPDWSGSLTGKGDWAHYVMIAPDPTRTWTGAAMHGSIGPICSTIMTGAVYAQQKELTYSIVTSGPFGTTFFVDVSNQDSCPPVTDANQWNCITNPGIWTTAPVGSASGQVPNNALEVVKGYRWIKWRLEGVVKSNATSYVNWAVKINPAE